MQEEPTALRRTEMAGSSPLETMSTVALLGANATDLKDAKTFGKIKEIVDFFSGTEDTQMVFSRVLRNVENKQKVDRMYEYVALRKQHIEAKKKATELEDVIRRYEE